MGAQEKTEEVLRKIHVFFSKAEPYNGSKRSVVVDKNQMMDLLKELNDCIYDMMDEYEVTKQSRDKADRRMKKEADDRTFEARKSAEDIYAASLMFSDRSLNELISEIDSAKSEIDKIHEDLLKKLSDEKSQIKENQLDLKASFQALIDTQKYMRLIDDENERIRKEKEAGKPEKSSLDDKPSYADVVPEIKVNQEYFEKTGQAFPDEDKEKDTSLEATEEGKKENSSEEIESGDSKEISEDLDKEYFDWKESKEDKADLAKEKAKKKGFALFGKKTDKE